MCRTWRQILVFNNDPESRVTSQIVLCQDSDVAFALPDFLRAFLSPVSFILSLVWVQVR